METRPTSDGTQQSPHTHEGTDESAVQGLSTSWTRAELPAEEPDEYQFWTWERREVLWNVLLRLGGTLSLLLLTWVVLVFTLVAWLAGGMDLAGDSAVDTGETDGSQPSTVGLVLAVIVFAGSVWPLVSSGAPRALRVFGIVYAFAGAWVLFELWQA